MAGETANMDILLIDPPYKSFKGMGIDCAYNMGLACLAAYLNAQGVEASILTGDLLADMAPGNMLNMDAAAYARGQANYQKAIRDDDHPAWKRISEVIEASSPSAVGIMYLTPAREAVAKTAALVKAVDPAIPVIVGGHHPTFRATQVLAEGHIDFAIRGEGEIPLAALVHEIIGGNRNWSTVPGLTYRDAAGAIHHTKDADPVADLDSLPYGARNRVLHCDYQAHRTHYVYTARGCPYTCAFCSDSRMWGRRVRRRSVSHVLAELRQLKADYDPAFVDISDGTFTYDQSYLNEFCERMIAEDLNLMWRCTARYDNLTAGMLQLMKKANCFGLYFGLESGSPRILQAVHKNTTPAQILETSKMVQDNGIVSMASVLLGLPDETPEEVEQTLDLMRHMTCDLFDINCYVPLPGTPLFDAMDPEEFDRIDWTQVGFKSLTTNFSKRIDDRRFREFVLEAYRIAEDARVKFMERMASLFA
jgi:radical SAM superfamily enzyme YgiQ (UPF0313 family)